MEVMVAGRRCARRAKAENNGLQEEWGADKKASGFSWAPNE